MPSNPKNTVSTVIPGTEGSNPVPPAGRQERTPHRRCTICGVGFTDVIRVSPSTTTGVLGRRETALRPSASTELAVSSIPMELRQRIRVGPCPCHA